MISEKKISVIVPVYNSKKYLNRCVESIINQSYLNLEILLVNDGSTDGSELICDEWSKKDLRVNVIHQKNRGVSAARNNGINVASGDYISFIDSDDFINQDMFKCIIEKMEHDRSDIGVCNFNIINNDKCSLGILNKPNSRFDLALVDEFHDSVGGYLWNKIYSKDLIKNHFLEEKISMMEDLYFNLSLCENMNVKYSFIDSPLYNYNIYPNSISHNKKIDNLSLFITLKYIIDFFKKKNEYDLVYKYEARYIVEYGYYNYIFNGNDDYKLINKDLLNNINYFIKEDKLLNKHISFLLKIKIFLIIYLNPLYIFIKKMKSE
ncbi:MAG: glycosyltransferase [bacterium]|nr:glycosyltransferase [bacterium]